MARVCHTRTGFGLTIFALFFALAPNVSAAPEVILVIGEPGQPEYASRFKDTHAAWTNLFAAGEIEATVIGVGSNAAGSSDLQQLRAALSNATDSAEARWLILSGHGSFDGRDARFNLRGPDITASELKSLLPGGSPERPEVVVAAFASSIVFLPQLSASNRVVVSATRDLGEDSFSYFGSFLPKALASEVADVDQDGAVSLLEGWLLASKLTAEHYVNEQRILTEHALIDDNADQKGTPTEAFRGLRAKPMKEGATADGLRAGQLALVPSAAERAMSPEARAQRDALERELLILRDKKAGFEEDEYYRQLKVILLKLGKVYQMELPAE